MRAAEPIMARAQRAGRARPRAITALLVCTVLVAGPAGAAGTDAAALAAEMRARGEPEAEVRLALAGLFARRGALAQARQQLEVARQQGLAAWRLELQLADV